jgi:hypothetical protein
VDNPSEKAGRADGEGASGTLGHVDNSASGVGRKVPISTEKVLLNGLAEVGYNAPP